MSGRDELLELDEELQQRKIELFDQEFMVSKAMLVRRIKQVVQRLDGQIARTPADNLEKKAFHIEQKSNLIEFLKCVENTTLFEDLEPWWFYKFEIGSWGTELYICHADSAEVEGNGHDEWIHIYSIDAEFKLIETKCEYLSAEEFARQRGVAPATIRVWIRRGKIRSAMKDANGWMIPKLAAPIDKGYSDAEYRWNVYIANIPAGFEQIQYPGEIYIKKIPDNIGYRANYYNHNGELKKSYDLSKAEKEKLESYLISNPAIQYIGDKEIIMQ